MTLLKNHVGIGLTLAATFAVACTLDPHGELDSGSEASIDVVEQAFGEASCAEAEIDGMVELGGATYTSPRTYDNPDCHDSVVVEGIPDPDYHPRVTWADTLPTNRTACEQLWLAAQHYRWDFGDTAWVKAGGSTLRRGTWASGACTISGIGIVPDPNMPFRITASARLSNSGATRKVRVGWQLVVW